MNRRRWIVAAVALLAAAGFLIAPAGRVAASFPFFGTRSYVLPGDRVFPEGIAYHPSTGNFFVSSTTDGTIFRGNVFRTAARPFLPGGGDGRTTAVGLKVDDRDRLFIAGGGTGRIFVYDADDGELIRRFNVADPADGPTFINDVAVTPEGDAFFTDSLRPVLYRVFEDDEGELAVEVFVNFDGTALQYTPGFNVNGIAASPDGRYLVVVQSNTGRLFRIALADGEVAPIDLGGATLTNGDGLLLAGGRDLYVVRNQQGLIARVRLDRRLLVGRVAVQFSDPSFRFPTTAALAGFRLLVVNSQFNRRGPGLVPDLPFTVSSVVAR